MVRLKSIAAILLTMLFAACGDPSIQTNQPTAANSDVAVSAQASQWLAAYKAAWENRDAAAAAAIFTEDAEYHDSPYNRPYVGKDSIAEYWAGVTADQRNVVFESEVIAIDGQTVVAEWSAQFTIASMDESVELDGVFILELAADGRCEVLREWWMIGGQ